MADIFISYASEDREAARRLADALAGPGWSVFWNRTIPPGKTWRQVVGAALTEARCVVVMWSEASIHSTWVQEEADDGRERGVLIPILIEPVRPPIGFRSLQAADLSGWEGNAADVGFKVLIGALSDLLEMPGGEREGAALNLPAAAVLDEVAEKADASGKARGARQPKAAAFEEVAPSVGSNTLGGRSQDDPVNDVVSDDSVRGSVGADPGTLPDFAVFRDIDAAWCPEMVVLPAGSFLMGSSKTDKGAWDDEKPRHRVTIGGRIAVGRYPVTVGEYRRFVDATGRRQGKIKESSSGFLGIGEGLKETNKDWSSPGFVQTDRHPVVGVSWTDARDYVEWLSGETGASYRLLSEAEWEYACRAGTETRYCFGDTITEKQANFGGKVGNTTEVGSYPANSWGLNDMHGNVWEWAADVWHQNYYKGAPDDGRARTGGGYDSRRVVRGGSWHFRPRSARSASRFGYDIGLRYYYSGFRVARTF